MSGSARQSDPAGVERLPSRQPAVTCVTAAKGSPDSLFPDTPARHRAAGRALADTV
jgi:hypothetical protein